MGWTENLSKFLGLGVEAGASPMYPQKMRVPPWGFVTGNYVFETGSMTGILCQLKWESLTKRRKQSRLILLYKCLKGKARIPTDDLRMILSYEGDAVSIDR